MGIKRAKTKEVRRLTPAELGGRGARAASIHLDQVYLPQHAKHTQLFGGNPQEAAAQLVEKLRFEARVI
jgi:electron transfer flavoprotein beta subunit